MRKVVVLAVLVAVLPGPVPSVVASPVHKSVSMITDIDRESGFLVVKLDDGQLLRLVVDKATAGDDLASLQPGDVIREECAMDEAGVAKARLIVRVRQAWMEIGSPEM